MVAGDKGPGTIDVMPNGKPGDHLLTDITVHRMEVFGVICDDLIWEICRRGGQAALESLELVSLDPRFGGQPDLAALEVELRNIRDHLPSVGD